MITKWPYLSLCLSLYPFPGLAFCLRFCSLPACLEKSSRIWVNVQPPTALPTLCTVSGHYWPRACLYRPPLGRAHRATQGDTAAAGWVTPHPHPTRTHTHTLLIPSLFVVCLCVYRTLPGGHLHARGTEHGSVTGAERWKFFKRLVWWRVRGTSREQHSPHALGC